MSEPTPPLNDAKETVSPGSAKQTLGGQGLPCGRSRLNEGLSEIMADGRFVPADAQLLIALAPNYDLTVEDVLADVFERLKSEGFRPVGDGHAASAAPLTSFSVPWERKEGPGDRPIQADVEQDRSRVETPAANSPSLNIGRHSTVAAPSIRFMWWRRHWQLPLASIVILACGLAYILSSPPDSPFRVGLYPSPPSLPGWLATRNHPEFQTTMLPDIEMFAESSVDGGSAYDLIAVPLTAVPNVVRSWRNAKIVWITERSHTIDRLLRRKDILDAQLCDPTIGTAVAPRGSLAHELMLEYLDRLSLPACKKNYISHSVEEILAGVGRQPQRYNLIGLPDPVAAERLLSGQYEIVKAPREHPELYLTALVAGIEMLSDKRRRASLTTFIDQWIHQGDEYTRLLSEKEGDTIREVRFPPFLNAPPPTPLRTYITEFEPVSVQGNIEFMYESDQHGCTRLFGLMKTTSDLLGVPSPCNQILDPGPLIEIFNGQQAVDLINPQEIDVCALGRGVKTTVVEGFSSNRSVVESVGRRAIMTLREPSKNSYYCLVGRGDPVGTPEVNRRIGYDRANAVESELLMRFTGLRKDHIVKRSRGSEPPEPSRRVDVSEFRLDDWQ
jgi:hypothetical protein